MYNHGGVYMDVNIELQRKSLTGMLRRAHKANKTLIVAHEDKDAIPLHARLETKPGVVRKYISNGFFAATQKHPVLKMAVSSSRLDRINWRSKMINQETGPFYWRESMLPHHLKNIMALKTEEIYPMSLYEQFGHGPLGESADRCIDKRPGKTKVPIVLQGQKRFLKLPCKRYTGSYSVDHFDFGGTWIK